MGQQLLPLANRRNTSRQSWKISSDREIGRCSHEPSPCMAVKTGYGFVCDAKIGSPHAVSFPMTTHSGRQSPGPARASDCPSTGNCIADLTFWHVLRLKEFDTATAIVDRGMHAKGKYQSGAWVTVP